MTKATAPGGVVARVWSHAAYNAASVPDHRTTPPDPNLKEHHMANARDELRKYVNLLADSWTPRQTTDERVERLYSLVRAEVLREAAEVAVRAARASGDTEAGQYAATVAAGIGKELRRMADEAGTDIRMQPTTP